MPLNFPDGGALLPRIVSVWELKRGDVCVPFLGTTWDGKPVPRARLDWTLALTRQFWNHVVTGSDENKSVTVSRQYGYAPTHFDGNLLTGVEVYRIDRDSGHPWLLLARDVTT